MFVCLSSVWTWSIFVLFQVFMFKSYSINGRGGDGLSPGTIVYREMRAGCGLTLSVNRNVFTSFLRTGTRIFHSETQEHLNKTWHPVILTNWSSDAYSVPCTHTHNLLSHILFHNTAVNMINMSWSERKKALLPSRFAFNENRSVKLFLENWADIPETPRLHPDTPWHLLLCSATSFFFIALILSSLIIFPSQKSIWVNPGAHRRASSAALKA